MNNWRYKTKSNCPITVANHTKYKGEIGGKKLSANSAHSIENATLQNYKTVQCLNCNHYKSFADNRKYNNT